MWPTLSRGSVKAVAEDTREERYRVIARMVSESEPVCKRCEARFMYGTRQRFAGSVDAPEGQMESWAYKVHGLYCLCGFNRLDNRSKVG